MAVTFQSVQTTALTGSVTSVTITKPASTAVGDLLLGFIYTNDTVSSVPTGWTLVTSLVGNAGGTIYLYYVNATSTQTAASNFTWGITNSALAGGSITRITGHNTANFSIVNTAFHDNIASPTFTNTITPTTANSLLLFYTSGINSAGGSMTSAGYTIATSNPSWTEAYDISDASTNSQTAMAYANRTQTTATGNSSCTYTSSGGTSDFVGLLIAIPPQFSFTGTETGTILDSTIRKVTKIFLDNEDVNDTLITEKDRIWSNPDKTSTNWVNQDKS